MGRGQNGPQIPGFRVQRPSDLTPVAVGTFKQHAELVDQTFGQVLAKLEQIEMQMQTAFMQTHALIKVLEKKGILTSQEIKEQNENEKKQARRCYEISRLQLSREEQIALAVSEGIPEGQIAYAIDLYAKLVAEGRIDLLPQDGPAPEATPEPATDEQPEVTPGPLEILEPQGAEPTPDAVQEPAAEVGA
jgi:hypothetical protein